MTSVIFQCLGGLGLFLFGMKIMSEGLQKVAGKKMRQVLGTVSNNRFIGCGAGTFVTSVIQSSSATTVMLVSFVDAGLMTLTQATGVILGANIGTTVTAQLIAFKIEAYALPAIAVGIFLKFFVNRRKWVYAGEVLLGFGLVFYGLATMKAGFSPLKQDPAFISVFTKFRADSIRGILLCMVAGCVLTTILQSSSATVGITMALACQGLLHFETSAALVLGTEIGTTITAQIAALGANINAHRTATAHSFINVIGVFIIILFFPLFIKLVVWLTSSLMGIGPPDFVIGGQKPNIARHIANFQTIFNVITALFFLMVLPYVVKAAIWFTPHKKDGNGLDELHHIKYLDSKYIDTPSMALAQAGAEIVRMGEAVQVMYDNVIHSIEERKLKELSKWRKREDALDILQREITQFLVRTMQGPISPEESREVRSLIRMTNNLERIGDATEDVAESIEELIEQDLSLSEEALKDYEKISNEVWKFLILVVDAMRQEDREMMPKAREIENNINTMEEEMKASHLFRLQRGICKVDAGLVFVNILTAFEKMGGFCFNISEAVAGLK
ncbi:MAG: Na/Pi cotransporter family protein [Desulfobacteraceae bacterium]|nr:MAG: Na/Pi cotransporter family protein [Desulfobacteraceae bacterium]